jgi:hypothetical protein
MLYLLGCYLIGLGDVALSETTAIGMLVGLLHANSEHLINKLVVEPLGVVAQEHFNTTGDTAVFMIQLLVLQIIL